jgi:hypothetical protein
MYSYADRVVSPAVPIRHSQEQVSKETKLVKNSSQEIAATTHDNVSQNPPDDSGVSTTGTHKADISSPAREKNRRIGDQTSSLIVDALSPRQINGERVWQCPKHGLKLSPSDETSMPANKSQWVSEFSQLEYIGYWFWFCHDCDDWNSGFCLACLNCGGVKCADCRVELIARKRSDVK